MTDICLARDPGYSPVYGPPWVCTLDRGHAGDHVADDGNPYEVAPHRWPAKPAANQQVSGGGRS